MTTLPPTRRARGNAARLWLAGLALALAGCSAAPGKPPPPAAVLDLYAATYGALPGTAAGPATATERAGEPAAVDPSGETAGPEAAGPEAAADVSEAREAPAPSGEAPPAADEFAVLAPAVDIVAPVPETEPAAPPEVDATPSVLFGLDEAGIVALLGPAHYLRNEPPARVLQYAGRACVLDLFLYPEGPGGAMEAVYFEMRPTGETPAPSGCFAELVLAARGY